MEASTRAWQITVLLRVKMGRGSEYGETKKQSRKLLERCQLLL